MEYTPGLKSSVNNQITLNESIFRKINALQTIARSIVHKTNNYYGIIQGYLSMLEIKPTSNENVRKFLPPMKEALQSGIALNKRLAEFYRPSQEITAKVDLAAVVREVCTAFTQKENFALKVVVSGDFEDIPLNETTIKSLIGDLCHLAKITGTSPAQIELAPVDLEAETTTTLVMESQPGPYVRLRTALSLADYPQKEETEFLNPFANEYEYSSELGLALLWIALQNHGGNLDVTARDEHIIIDLYFPR